MINRSFLILGEYYGLDLSRPATNAQEAVQWVYMAYLAAVNEQDGAAMSLGNVSSFLDIYIQYDLDQMCIRDSGDTHKQLLARSRYLLFKSADKWTESQRQRAEVLFETCLLYTSLSYAP